MILKRLEKLYRKSLKKAKMTNFLKCKIFGNHAQAGGATIALLKSLLGKK